MPKKRHIDLSLIHGRVTPGFEPVREAFIENFRLRKEIGAACAVYHRGAKVVDLWGGWRDRKRRLPWEEDTLVLVFSTTKGMAAAAVALAQSRGLLDFDAPVARYWPEFAQHGKERVTIRQLLAHQAGLCAIDQLLDAADLADLDHLASILARQAPAWEPGTRHGYHAVTLGWYEGELLRRADPQRRTLGQFFRDEIAQPLGIEFYIGTPAEIPDARIAQLKDFRPMQVIFHLRSVPLPFLRALLNPRSLSARAFLNPKVRRPRDFGEPPLRALEVPAVNGIGQVRAIARVYSVLATGGKELGLREETLRQLLQPAVPPALGRLDEVLRVETAYALGFTKPFPDFPFGGEHCFGQPGLGGSFGFADPAAQVGYAYAPNRLGFYLWDDPRDRALRTALYRCLK